jgi:hypothetical protein
MDNVQKVNNCIYKTCLFGIMAYLGLEMAYDTYWRSNHFCHEINWVRKFIVTVIKHFVNTVQELKRFKQIVLFESVLSLYVGNLNMEGREALECTVCS